MWIPAECETTSLERAAELREPGFIFEEKHDGLRAVCEVGAGGNRITGRRFNDDGTLAEITKPHAAHLRTVRFARQWRGSVFDGELMPDGVYIIFDVLAHGGLDLRGECLETRRQFMVGRLPAGVRWIQQHDTFSGVGCFGEGVVIKDLRSKYGFGWWKAKRVETDDVLVTAVYHDGTAAVSGGGKVCGVPYAVRVGDCIEVEFFKRFASGKLRNGKFLRLRDDKRSNINSGHAGVQPRGTVTC